MATPLELAAMRQAIALSALGLGTTSPNPPVGCVILNAAGQLVGRGFHRRKGEAHAETLALAKAGVQARGGTAVVTLSPCNHYGRTPPCHQALIDAGVRRVVVALRDPTSRGKGGIVRLRQAGIDVEADVLADQALLVLGPWLRALDTKRPHVQWLCLMGYSPNIDALAVVPDAADLLASHDVVLTASGHIREAVPGVHGGQLDLQAQLDLTQPEQALAKLYSGGVRSVLLTGTYPEVGQLLMTDQVDEVHIYMSDTMDQHGDDWPPLPPDTRMLRVTKLSDWVRLTAEFKPADHGSP